MYSPFSGIKVSQARNQAGKQSSSLLHAGFCFMHSSALKILVEETCSSEKTALTDYRALYPRRQNS
jgi:hypothetical protein